MLAPTPPPAIRHIRKPDGGLDWSKVKSIRIVKVEDYHD